MHQLCGGCRFDRLSEPRPVNIRLVQYGSEVGRELWGVTLAKPGLGRGLVPACSRPSAGAGDLARRVYQIRSKETDLPGERAGETFAQMTTRLPTSLLLGIISGWLNRQ